MIRFSLLGSGSSGNALLVACPQGAILVDAGLSFKRLNERAQAVGESLENLRAVFVTHEHGDHVLGLGTLARKTGVPVYLTQRTLDGLPKSVGLLPNVKLFEAGDRLSVGDLEVDSFSVWHDAADPVSYVVRCGGGQLGLATDLGKPSHLVRERLAGSHALILESNYCPNMLRTSSYPAAIRQRIKGTHGHLSNAEMNSLLADLLHDRLQWVVAVHISQENNTEELARSMAQRVLGTHPARLVLAQQDAPTPVFNIAV